MINERSMKYSFERYLNFPCTKSYSPLLVKDLVEISRLCEVNDIRLNNNRHLKGRGRFKGDSCLQAYDEASIDKVQVLNTPLKTVFACLIQGRQL